MKLDRNGYAPSLLNEVENTCYLCGKMGEKLDRHEVFNGAYRQKSKRLGLWCSLCHFECHLNGVHNNAKMNRRLKQQAQKAAMKEYDWTIDEFRNQFSKNYLED